MKSMSDGLGESSVICFSESRMAPGSPLELVSISTLSGLGPEARCSARRALVTVAVSVGMKGKAKTWPGPSLQQGRNDPAAACGVEGLAWTEVGEDGIRPGWRGRGKADER